MTNRAARWSRRPPLWGEMTLGLLGFAVYLLIDSLGGPARRAEAIRHGVDIASLEQLLHVDVEHALNGWLVPHAVLSTLADYEYAFTYVASALLLLGWTYVCRPEAYRPTRDSFLLLNLIGFACFAIYPVCPPRLLPGLGFVDTVLQGHTVGSWGTPMVANANQLAAMPSLHVAWALWVSVVLARLAGGIPVQTLSAVHVVVTVLVIVATANHFVLDAVAAVPLIAVSVLLADLRDRRRRAPAPLPATDAGLPLNAVEDGRDEPRPAP